MSTHGQPPGGPDPADSSDGAAGDEVRRGRLVALLTVPDAGTGDGVRADDSRVRLGRVCVLSLTEVGVSGAGITVMAGTAGGLAGARDQLWSTGAVTRRLEDLQLTAGEGPCLDAYSAGAPVLVGDLDGDSVRWLGFAPDAVAAGAAAVFSLPLQVGAVRLGTLDLHRDTVGALSRDQLADALMLATLATEALLELADLDSAPAPSLEVSGGSAPDTGGDGSGPVGDTPGWLPDVHAEVHQASGMVSAREGIGVGQALLRIRAYAYARGQPIDRVARRIIDRELILDDHGQDDPGTTFDSGSDDGPENGREPASPDAERNR